MPITRQEAETAFQDVEKLRAHLLRQQEVDFDGVASTHNAGVPNRVELGRVTVDGQEYEVAFANLRYAARSDNGAISFRDTQSWVLGVGEVRQGRPTRLSAIAYETDLLRLNDNFTRPLVGLVREQLQQRSRSRLAAQPA